MNRLMAWPRCLVVSCDSAGKSNDCDTFNSDIDLSCYVFHVNYQFDFATICKK